MSSIKGTKTFGSYNETLSYKERKAVRLLISNNKDQVIVVHMNKGNYYKLPGGGIEDVEDHTLAGEREASEETGCKVSIGDYLCTIEEWRDGLHQFSYYYTAKLVEDTDVLGLTEIEAEEGLTHQWVDVGKVVEMMKGCVPTSQLGESIKERDLYFVEKYLEV
jgi:8-oxo-dGTP diphosphatase